MGHTQTQDLRPCGRVKQVPHTHSHTAGPGPAFLLVEDFHCAIVLELSRFLRGQCLFGLHNPGSWQVKGTIKQATLCKDL